MSKFSLPTGVSITNQEECKSHLAVLEGKTEDIDVRAKATLVIENGPTIEGATPVHLAALVGATDFLKAAPVEAIKANSPDGRTTAEFAARGNQLQSIKVLAERGAPLNEKSGSDVTPLWVAVQVAALPVVRELIEVHKLPAAECKKETSGHTLLHCIVQSTAPMADRLAVLEYLLGLKQVDVDAMAEFSGERGEKAGSATAFAVACGLQEEGSLTLVEALFRANGHRTNLQDASGTSKQSVRKVGEDEHKEHPHHHVKESEKKNTIVFQKRKGFPAMPMVQPSSHTENAPAPVMPQKAPGPSPAAGSPQQQGAAAADSADTKKKEDEENSSNSNATYVVKLDRKRSRINSPLHVACQAQRLDVVRFLIERAGFDVDKNALVGDKEQVSPFYLSIRYAGADEASCNLDVAKYLLDSARVDIDKQCTDGATAVYCASFFNLTAPLKFLIEKNASTSISYKGATPIFGAVAGDAPEAAKILLAANADTLTTYKGMGVAAYARSEGREKFTQILAALN